MKTGRSKEARERSPSSQYREEFIHAYRRSMLGQAATNQTVPKKLALVGMLGNLLKSDEEEAHGYNLSFDANHGAECLPHRACSNVERNL